MKLGIAMFPADFAVRPDELARAVEDRGFESLFLPEHTHMPATERTRAEVGELPAHFSHTHDLFVALTYAAAATRSLLVGTGICLVPQRDPIVTAKAVASLDALSGGRVLFGVGAGWISEEIAQHGTDPGRRWSVTAERVKAMRWIWGHDVAEFHGEHVRFGPLWSWPKPHRPSGPPVLVGGSLPFVASRVLDFGDEWMPHAGMPVAELAARIAKLRAAGRADGRADDVPVTVFGAEPEPAHLAELRDIGVNRAVRYAPPADPEAVHRFLDQVAPLTAAFSNWPNTTRQST
ncbi:LLM class F420-dependent oxidoreductase [Streptomyces sp. Qhu-G9]|uniref:LLM class F420-dependent oxidoreductase n=1 Tax=Streptomyces sp. Qhu-G9 TaxID=3452799 RepID=UPI0022AC8B7A|nr:LLM class F420-dependent oxidoreductase [Streptomyces aurantiacus]WAU82147.1 LLM class F420-dependent oxidoreductase [Streptomyces aurantiacus]